mgnify:CR=1 FL=1
MLYQLELLKFFRCLITMAKQGMLHVIAKTLVYVRVTCTAVKNVSEIMFAKSEHK